MISAALMEFAEAIATDAPRLILAPASIAATSSLRASASDQLTRISVSGEISQSLSGVVLEYSANFCQIATVIYHACPSKMKKYRQLQVYSQELLLQH